MTHVSEENWTPSPGIRLEGKALEIVQSDRSLTVLAGPGSGKTEILAQRAAYLLQTGACPPPRKIIAIAFKVDAARNLLDRVTDRCGQDVAKRFESLTLDAFAKRLLDQFLEAVPEPWRPTADYTIFFPNRDIWEDFGQRNSEDHPTIRGKNNRQLDKLVHSSMPCFSIDDISTPDHGIQFSWWHENVKATQSRLTFDMIKLLATHILSSRPAILEALRNTYSHVFLDEFQDFTSSQYELLKAGFFQSDALLTAVGDTNQAIMRWAGARKDIFQKFEEDFNADSERLLYNFRSNSRIVSVINSLASGIENDYVETVCARQNEDVSDDAVSGWVFNTREDEAKYLATYISNELRDNQQLSASDFVILARLRVDDIEKRLRPFFESEGVKLRNDARLLGKIAVQDLTKERAFQFFKSAFKLSVGVREGMPFQECRDTIADLRGLDISTERGHSETLRYIRELLDSLKALSSDRVPSTLSGAEVSEVLLQHVELSEFKKAFREYSSEDRLNDVVSGFEQFFDECRSNAATWQECIDNIEGANTVRLMTIHKSKGLEYHTVIFLELNDDAFWGNDDDVNVFFVALSRARERVHFSVTRDSRGIENVRDFYNDLGNAGVSFTDR